MSAAPGDPPGLTGLTGVAGDDELNPQPVKGNRWKGWKGWPLHLARLGMLAAIVGLARQQQAQFDAARATAGLAQLPPAQLLKPLRQLFPKAAGLGGVRADVDGRLVIDSAGATLGYVVQTSPAGDDVIGFSGPTNMLVGFDNDGRSVGVEVLSSGDTRDHVELVRRNQRFRTTLRGATWETAASRQIDAVSGATLTSLAAAEAISKRLGAEPGSLRFPATPTLEKLQSYFAVAAPASASWDRIELQPESRRWLAYADDKVVAQLLRTVPAGDQIIGYQGPTEVWLLLSADGAQVDTFALGESFDNPPYVGYVRDDAYFRTIFQDNSLGDLASIDLYEAQVEGVSGATMTSMAVAESIVAAAKLDRDRAAARREADASTGWTRADWSNLLACALIAMGVVIALTRLRGNRVVGQVWRWLLIATLGLAHGDMISQAMLVGWAQHGIPFANAPSLALLTAAALILPTISGRNIYCSHLCAHGAAQQLLRNRAPWRLRIHPSVDRWLKRLPGLLLALVVGAAFGGWRLDLVDIEPFDAWSLAMVGAPMIIAVGGLAWSAMTPMAYCRYGCPTGALLNYARKHGRSDRWQSRDWLAVALVGAAATTIFF